MHTPKLIIVLGTNGTGKTTLLSQFIKNESKKTLVIAPDDKDWINIPLIANFQNSSLKYNGVLRHIWEDKTDLDTVTDRFKDGLLVCDDCRSYFSSGNIDKGLHKLLIRRRQMQVDILVAAHGFSEVPPKFYTFATDIILFKTNDNVASRKNVIKDYTQMLRMQMAVNCEAETDPHFKIRITL